MRRALREWESWSAVSALVPTRAPAPLLPRALSLAHIDACSEFLALAADLGLVFWYDRRSKHLQRLRPENSRSPITFVKLVSTVDYMVAAGNKSGQVTIFQIPKPHSDTVPDHIKPKSSQVERYTIGDLHKSEITCLEWSKNGMRLFSGDKDGVVVMTEIDFYMHICKSSEIINETYEIVQLSYYQNHLLISSVYRSIICHYNQENSKWSVNQVGKKDRKSLCKLGGVFHFNYNKPNEVNIYSARPGLRIWTSDKQGNVLKTLLFKDAIANPSNQIELLNPCHKKNTISLKDSNFGPLLIFNDEYIISYNEELLYILDPETLLAVATIDKFQRILSVAINKDEIFVLEGDRSIVRIAYCPDERLQNMNENPMSRSLLNPIQLAVNTIKDLTNADPKKHLTDFTDQFDYFKTSEKTEIPTFTDTTCIVKAEECFELPPIVQLNTEFEDSCLQLTPNFEEDEIVENIENCEVYKQDEMDAVGTVHTLEHLKSKKPQTNLESNESIYQDDILHSTKKCKKINIIDIFQNDSDKSNELNAATVKSPKTTRPNVMNISYCGENFLMPDNRSPETIEKEIRDKEEKLAKVFDLEPITISSIKPDSSVNLLEKDEIYSNSDRGTSKAKAGDEIEIRNSPMKLSNKKIEPLPELTPQCVSIPNVWNLKELKIISENEKLSQKSSPLYSCDNANNSTSRVFDADWELI